VETLLVNGAAAAELLPLTDCIAVVEDAFRSLGLRQIAPPGTLSVTSERGTFHVKAGVLERGSRRYFAAKCNGNFPGNATSGVLPTIQGVVILCDADDGRVLALLDSIAITALRTAAATAVAVRHLARAESTVAAICGCGVQGRAQLRALASVLPLRRVHAYDVRPETASAYAMDMSELLGIDVIAEPELAQAVAGADVCVTCTPATDFIVHPNMLRPGTFVAGVGVDSATKRELAPALLSGAAKVVTDLREQCARIGDLHHAIASGAMTAASVHADLADVVVGRRAGRETDDEVIVFDSTGLALQDVAAAAAIYERAQRAGSDLPGFAFSSSRPS
jgi:ornithine cyclodeaminase/alanine dehydrogenase-like protein (mu-crystallin family)